MPFKLFTLPRKVKKDKSASKSVADLVMYKSEEYLDCEVKTNTKSQKSEEPPDCEVKATSKSKFHHFFSNHKNNNHVHFKDTNKHKKVKNGTSLGQENKTKSLSHIPSDAKEDAVHSADSKVHHSKVHRQSLDNQSAKPQSRPTRAASYGNYMDTLSRERRLMEIAQLDNYIEYLRHTEDEGNLTNRMCCAQVLKMGLIRIELAAHRNSHERLDRTSPVNGISQRPKNRTNRTKNEQADESDQDSNSSDRKEDDSESDHITFSNDNDCDSRGSEHDSGTEHDHDNSCGVQESCSRSKRMPVWPRDIEIF